MARRRLDQVDAMRPVKQAGVISTHAILYCAPEAASAGSGAALLLLHVSREGFFFISACMLTYAHADLNRAGLRRFYWRRFLSVGIPYLCLLECHLLPLHSSGIALREHDGGVQRTRLHRGDRVLPAVLPARDHAVLPAFPARAGAAAAYERPPRPDRRRRDPGPGRDRDRYALAVPLTGRTQVPWRRPRRFPPHPAVLGDRHAGDAVEPLTQGVAGSWHA
jgi:hypothetical protein